jgi:hypothetical protein
MTTRQPRRPMLARVPSQRRHRPVALSSALERPGVRFRQGCSRDTILRAIAKARCWIEDLASGRVRSFAEIAQREGKVERHIRLLTPLAFTPPQTLAAIIAGAGSSDLTVTTLSHTIPWAWPS